MKPGLPAAATGLLWAAMTAAAAAAGTAGTLGFSLGSDHHADAVPLSALSGGDFGRVQAARLAPRQGRNLAWIDDEARLRWQAPSGWQWSVLARQSGSLVISDDALRLAAQIAQGQALASDADWRVQARLRAFSGAGLALGRESDLGAWRISWELQGLALGRWRQRDVAGWVQGQAASQSYAFALRSDETDNRLDLPFQTTAASQGAGLLGALSLQWRGDVLQAGLALRDAGWLHWSRLPAQGMTLDTRTAATDADGFLLYRPLIQGQNQQATLTRWQVPRWTLSADVRLAGSSALGGEQRVGLRLDTLPGAPVLPALTWQRPSQGRSGLGGVQWDAAWQLHQRRLTLGLKLERAWGGLLLRAGADAHGHSREWALAWQQAL